MDDQLSADTGRKVIRRVNRYTSMSQSPPYKYEPITTILSIYIVYTAITCKMYCRVIKPTIGYMPEVTCICNTGKLMETITKWWLRNGSLGN